MDKGTQEKVAEEKKSYSFDYSWAVVCKGCKQIHRFIELRDSQILFPEGDFSIISVYCRWQDEFFEYQNEETMKPLKEGQSQTSKALHLVARAIDQTNKRLTALENYVGIAKSDEERKTLRERVAETEDIITRIAEVMLQGKGSTQKQTTQKEPPPRQFT